jgi:hypothetical protein
MKVFRISIIKDLFDSTYNMSEHLNEIVNCFVKVPAMYIIAISVR